MTVMKSPCGYSTTRRRRKLRKEIKETLTIYFFGSIGALIGFLGSDESSVKLVFKVDYADGSTKVVVEKANSKAAENLFSIMNK